MPIYEYQCAACGRVVEKWQKVSESPLQDCPACGGSLTKIISSCSFQLKGSGWYVTDYAGKSQPSQAAGDGQEASAGSEGEKGGAGAAESSAPAKIK
jgi:putative FmdB family regulatory protein